MLAPSDEPAPRVCPALASGSSSLRQQSPLMCHVCLTIGIKQHVEVRETRESCPTSSAQLSVKDGELREEEKKSEEDRAEHRV